MIVRLNIYQIMLTGKIYKNKLSSLQEQTHYNYHNNVESKQIARVKSQPGFTAPNLNFRYQNAESIPVGTLISQRQKLIQEMQQNSYINSFNKQLPQQNIINLQISHDASDIILEYQRKMKDHVQKIQTRYQAKISNLQSALQAKDVIIEQLKNALKEKQKLIDKLQDQQCKINTSRPSTSRYA